MRKVLHILTKTNDPLAQEIIAAQRQQPNHDVRVVDWTTEEPDGRALLQEIFDADSIEIW